MATLPGANVRQKKRIEKTLLTRELLDEYNTLVWPLYSVTRAVMQYVCISVFLLMFVYGLITELTDGSSRDILD